MAECLVGEFLAERGLEPISGNWRRRLGEIDLVMRDSTSGTIVFVEVRYRGGGAHGGGLASIDRHKRNRMRRAALAWLQAHADPDTPARIDAVAVGPTPPSGSIPSGEDGERVVVRRNGYLLEWVVSAVEEQD